MAAQCVNGVLLVLSMVLLVRSQVPVQRSSVDEYLNTCLDGLNHKSKPGPESSTFQQCAPWRKWSCCTSSVARDMHLTENWLNFDWNHCKELSPRCRERFIQDLCFYECSPNVGPWIVEDKRKIRNEKYVNVPLCRDECDDWWADCQNEVTCLEDWSTGFNWSAGINKCPNNKPCRPFKEIYRDSTHFCEAIWGKSWKVVEKGEACMTLWFDPDYGNPNDKIARQHAETLVNKSSTFNNGSFLHFFALCLSFLYFQLSFLER